MSINFEYERDTKGAVRYKEVAAEPIVGTLYIRKSHLDKLGLEGRESIVVEIRKAE